MTHATVRAMTDEQLRIRVAELLEFDEVWEKDGVIVDILDPPDYQHDLNACHEMEESLSQSKRGAYVRRLRASGISDFGTCCATARQRCEAFVIVMTGD